MNKYQLTQWEAIELFCKIISKYENIDISLFNKNEVLVFYLVKYSSDKLSLDFSKIHLQPIANEVGQENYYPKALYDLSQEIRSLEPVVRSASRLLLLLKYIEEENALMRYKTLGTWNPDDKQRLFEDTTWYLYYYESYTDPITRDVQTGVTRATVYLLPFAQLVIKDINAADGVPGLEEQFKGTYSIYGGGQFLLLQGRLDETLEKDLHVLLYIGTSRFEIGGIALGQYHDIGRSIYSGTIIMEKVDSNVSDLIPMFYKQDDSEIDAVIWEYFKNSDNNRMQTQLGITRKEALKNWIISREKQ